MIVHAQHSFNLNPVIYPRRPQTLTLTLPSSSRQNLVADASSSRRSLLLLPSLSIATAGLLRSIAPAMADENLPEPPPPSPSSPPPPTPPAVASAPVVEENKEEAVVSRVYDASVIGEPQALGKDKRKVWDKLLGARVVYLGEAELVPDKDDRELELEIVKSLGSRCLEKERAVSLALEAFPSNLQEQLDQFADGR